MTLFHVILALVLVPTLAYAVGRGLEDTGPAAGAAWAGGGRVGS